jgi:hypothetical protein
VQIGCCTTDRSNPSAIHQHITVVDQQIVIGKARVPVATIK